MNKKLQQKLLKMIKLDQTMRTEKKWDKNVDIQNTQEMKKIIKQYGWPDIDLVGKNGSEYAWLLIQHADHDIEFQEKCLCLIKEKIKNKKVSLANYAYLKDRINVNKKKLQTYGTQFYLKNNKLTPRPIRNKKELDKRRKKYGLKKFGDYKNKLLKNR